MKKKLKNQEADGSERNKRPEMEKLKKKEITIKTETGKNETKKENAKQSGHP